MMKSITGRKETEQNVNKDKENRDKGSLSKEKLKFGQKNLLKLSKSHNK